jgi:hypothetical protein
VPGSSQAGTPEVGGTVPQPVDHAPASLDGLAAAFGDFHVGLSPAHLLSELDAPTDPTG